MRRQETEAARRFRGAVSNHPPFDGSGAAVAHRCGTSGPVPSRSRVRRRCYRRGMSKGEIDAVTAEFFGAFDNRDGRTADVGRIRRLVVPGGVIVKTGPDYTVYGVESFITPRRALLDGGRLTGFSEWEVAERTEIEGDIASRLSAYRKSGVLDGEAFDGAGTKTFQFARTPDGWRITAMSWQDHA